MIIKMSPAQFLELIKKSYSADLVYMLKLIQEGHDIEPLCKESKKIKALRNTLVIKSLITESGEITTVGKSLLEFAESEGNESLKKVPTLSEEDFMRWWKTFPLDSEFEFRDRKFEGSRTLRQNKDKCRLKLDSILKEGKYTLDMLIEALEFQVDQMMAQSYMTNRNQLQYLPNSYRYLNEGLYEPIIEKLQRREKVQKEIIPGPLDI